MSEMKGKIAQIGSLLLGVAAILTAGQAYYKTPKEPAAESMYIEIYKNMLDRDQKINQLEQNLRLIVLARRHDRLKQAAFEDSDDDALFELMMSDVPDPVRIEKITKQNDAVKSLPKPDQIFNQQK